MVYSDDRDKLTNILLNSKGEEVLLNKNKILELVPELIVCDKCDHEHKAHKYNVFEHILYVVAGVESDLVLKLAALLHDIGKPYVKRRINEKINYYGHQDISVEIAKLVLGRLSFDKEIIDNVCLLVKYHDTKVKNSKEGIKSMIYEIGQSNLEKLFLLQTSDIKSHNDKYVELVLPRLE